jgi:hypothetical protein
MKTPVRSLIVALACVTLAACDSLGGDEDVAGLIASQFVNVTVDPPDLQDGLLVSDGAVTPQTFLTQLGDQMSTISAVDINFIKLRASPGADANIESWSELYQGELLVQFVPAGGGSAVQVGRVAIPATGLAELDATVTASRASLDAAPDIAAGNFAVRLTAGTSRAADDQFKLPIRVEIEFAAF